MLIRAPIRAGLKPSCKKTRRCSTTLRPTVRTILWCTSLARVWWYLLLKRELRTDVVSRVYVPPPDENMYVDRLLPTLWLTTSSTTTQHATVSFTADASDGAAQLRHPLRYRRLMRGPSAEPTSTRAPMGRRHGNCPFHNSSVSRRQTTFRPAAGVIKSTASEPDTSQLRPLVIHADACHRVPSTRITWYPRSKCH